MKISQYDHVLLKDGTKAVIVEVFGDGRFIANIDKNDDTYTEEIGEEQILQVLGFTQEQLDFMKRIGINVAPPFSDDDYIAIEEQVGDYLQIYGLDERYEPTADGRMCETILDALS